MSLLKEYIRQLLTELRVVGDVVKKGERYTVFAFKGWLITLRGYVDPHEIEFEELERDYGVDFGDIKNVSGWQDSVATDFLFGHVDKGVLQIPDLSTFSHSSSSVLLKKVVSTLGLSGVTRSHTDYDDATDSEHDSEQKLAPVGELPHKKNKHGQKEHVLFHGTSSTHLPGLFKTGLVPGDRIGQSNWKNQKIWHKDVVSLADSIEGVKFHARNAAKQSNGFPVVLSFRLPDPDRIVADYDVDTETDASTAEFDNVRKTAGKSVKPDKAWVGRAALKTSKDVGVIGYKGRIPASFIEDAWYWSVANAAWLPTTKRELFQMLEMVDNYGPESYESDPEDYEEVDDETDLDYDNDDEEEEELYK